MTPRERMIATLEHRKPDRVPIALGWRWEVTEAVMKHYGVADPYEVNRILGADGDRYAKVRFRKQAFERRINGEVKADFGGSGPAVLHDERTFENVWGVVQRVGTDGKYVEWAGGPFDHTDDLDSFDWPTEADLIDEPGLAEKVATFKAEGCWVHGSGDVHPFKQAWHMRGFENFLCDYVANPGWVEAIYDRLVTFNVSVNRRLAAAGVDQISYWGDVAMQDRMILPPDRWRDLDKPAWKRIIDETRAVNPEVRFFFHSDGDITPIVDDLIEVGFDFINPLQPECVNPAAFKARWGDRVTLDGGGSVQRTLPFGTLDDVRREVDFLMTTCAYNGGYVFRASNVVGFDCPVESVVTYYEMARDYDLSSLQGPPAEIPDPPCRSIKVDSAALGRRIG